MSLVQTVSESTHSETVSRQADRGSRGDDRPPSPPTQSTAHTGGSLTRVTANFTPRAMTALERVCEKTGDSRTDVLNMAVMVYETILDLINQDDGKTLRVQLPDEVRVLQFVG
jgi:hypothetical protein